MNLRHLFFPILTLLLSMPLLAEIESPRQAPTKPGEYRFKYIAKIDGKPVQMTYVLVLPNGYDTQPARKFPMLVFTHGAGECGVDGEALFNLGPAMELRNGNKFKESYPFILMAPQCPPRGERWDQPQMYKAVSQIVDAAIGSVRVDADRVYLTGLSMGGKGTWLAALEGADRFAAIAPMCAGTVHPEAEQKLKYVAVWMIAGSNDPDAMNANLKMSDVLKNNLAEVRNTIVPGVDHGVWPTFYASAQFYEWLLAHKRPSAAERKAMDATGAYASRKPAVPQAPGHYRLSTSFDLNGQPVPLYYNVYIPKGYSSTGPPAPAILFLHEYNTIGTGLKETVAHGPEAELEKKGNEQLKAGFPFVVISPQTPGGLADWSQKPVMDAVMKALDEAGKSMNLDKTRLYVTGLNEGAGAAWQLAANAPDRFAAVAPIVAAGGVNSPGNLDALKDVPTWAIVPDVNPIKGMFDGKATWKLTSENPAVAYKNQALYDWLLKQVKIK
jgi:predicted peptidase